MFFKYIKYNITFFLGLVLIIIVASLSFEARRRLYISPKTEQTINLPDTTIPLIFETDISKTFQFELPNYKRFTVTTTNDGILTEKYITEEYISGDIIYRKTLEHLTVGNMLFSSRGNEYRIINITDDKIQLNRLIHEQEIVDGLFHCYIVTGKVNFYNSKLLIN